MPTATARPPSCASTMPPGAGNGSRCSRSSRCCATAGAFMARRPTWRRSSASSAGGDGASATARVSSAAVARTEASGGRDLRARRRGGPHVDDVALAQFELVRLAAGQLDLDLMAIGQGELDADLEAEPHDALDDRLLGRRARLGHELEVV